jgi:hypothetical protein
MPYTITKNSTGTYSLRLTKNGQLLGGHHKSIAAAKRQIKAIEASKHKKNK